MNTNYKNYSKFTNIFSVGKKYDA